MKDIAPCLSAVQLTECRLSFEMTSPPEMTSSGVCHGRKDGWLQHGLVTSKVTQALASKLIFDQWISTEG